MNLAQDTTLDTGNDAAMIAVGLRAFKSSDRPIIQNLGPGILHLSTSNTNISTTGIELPVSSVYELSTTLIEGAGRIYLRASNDVCDVRILNVG